MLFISLEKESITSALRMYMKLVFKRVNKNIEPIFAKK
jgi:hypothetical protein